MQCSAHSRWFNERLKRLEKRLLGSAIAIHVALVAGCGSATPAPSAPPQDAATKSQWAMRHTACDASTFMPAPIQEKKMREGPVKHVGGWFLVAVVVALAAFFAWRGKVRIEHGPANRTIERFSGFERFTHWLTATSLT